MANKFSELRSRISPQAQARVGAKAQTMLAEIPLNELRQARGLSKKMPVEVLREVANSGDGTVKNPIPIPQGYASWLDYAIATMDARGAFADKMFTNDTIPNQDEVRAAAQAELDALKAAAKVAP